MRPRRRFGQNFLVDARIPELIVERAHWPEAAPVLEIGAGGGALTHALLQSGRRVWAVEIDRDLSRLLASRFAEEIARGQLIVTCMDAREIDADALARFARDPRGERNEPGTAAWVAGNLPYTATTPLLLWTLRHSPAFAGAVFMVQREYADRLLAPPGSRTYGSITVLTRAYAEAESVLRVGRSSFWPRPGVESTVLELRFPQPAPFTGDVRALERVLRAAFGQRRKMLANTLAPGLGLAREEVAHRLGKIQIDPRVRAEQLGLAEFARLALAFGGPDEREEP